jgi:putative hemolysin
VEDLLEELVGEIYDEFDQGVSGVRRQSDGSLVLPDAFPIHNLVDLGVWLPEGPYATLAGLVLQRLGRIPMGGRSRSKGAGLRCSPSSTTRSRVCA